MDRRPAGALAAPSLTTQWRYRTAVEAARMLNATARSREAQQMPAAEEELRRELPAAAER